MRAIAILAAIAMVASLFLSWLSPTIAGPVGAVPWDMLKQMQWNGDTLKSFVDSAPPELWVLVSTFVFAALFAVLAILGAASRLLALLAGGGVLGLLAYAALNLDKIVPGGMPVPSSGDLMELLKVLPDFVGPGAFAWVGGALVLFLSGLIGFGSRR